MYFGEFWTKIFLYKHKLSLKFYFSLFHVLAKVFIWWIREWNMITFVFKINLWTFYRIKVKTFGKYHFRFKLMFLMYEKSPDSEIFFIYSNGPSFYKTKGPRIYVKFNKHIPKIYIRELWNINCTYLCGRVWNNALGIFDYSSKTC